MGPELRSICRKLLPASRPADIMINDITWRFSLQPLSAQLWRAIPSPVAGRGLRAISVLITFRNCEINIDAIDTIASIVVSIRLIVYAFILLRFKFIQLQF